MSAEIEGMHPAGLRIFRISQTVNNDYETFDCAVVVADSPEQARRMYPGDGMLFDEQKQSWGSYGWAKTPDQVEVEEIGVATFGVLPGVICASYNAG